MHGHWPHPQKISEGVTRILRRSSPGRGHEALPPILTKNPGKPTCREAGLHGKVPHGLRNSTVFTTADLFLGLLYFTRARIALFCMTHLEVSF
jgi:hypothetical protein